MIYNIYINTALSYSFPNSNQSITPYKFLTVAFEEMALAHIQVSQEADNMVWYSHVFKNFPKFGKKKKEFSTVCCDPHSQKL